LKPAYCADKASFMAIAQLIAQSFGLRVYSAFGFTQGGIAVLYGFLVVSNVLITVSFRSRRPQLILGLLEQR
jgi:hypothetical protein